ncbi:response regulator [Algibacter mikhailovii]|uniref:response regulator n=1 Tax=Algibacter mikhailovii TaxID=425498 RepID=UPI002494A9C2|nr:response regulator [Algibacter mikhailovii]
MHPFLKKIVEAGNHKNDLEEEKASKTNLVVLAIPFAFAGLIWGILYFANGLYIPGAIPFSYAILSLISYFHFTIVKKYKFFRNSQLFLILILPFALQITLGGYIQSSAVILWGFIAPVGALVFFKTKQTIYWFVSYLSLVVIAFLINDSLPQYFNWDLSDKFINAIFVLNIVAVSSLIYAVQYHYVNKQTELKNAIKEKNESLAKQTEKLKENDKLKSQFFANISHEFRTPLTLILGLLNKQKNNLASEDLKEDAETMARNANRLLELINQLLDLSKLEAGELQLALVKANIIPTIKNTVLLYDSLGHEKNVTIVFNGNPIDTFKKHKPIVAYFDEEKLQKIMSNLISNAIKFSSNNSVITVDVKNKNETLKITVSNTGEEIPASKLPFIFNRFYQVDGESTRESEGTGIGLSLVKELVELHYGQVLVTSAHGKTTFSISIPLNESYFSNDTISTMSNNDVDYKVIPSAEIKKSNTAVDDAQTTENQLEILVVEDHTDIRNYILDILKTNYKVSLAVNGVDGYEKANKNIPDLIISDVMMPKMNGYELCSKLKSNENTNHIPVIMLTAKASQDNKIEGLETGADDYLTKPFDEKELQVRIKNLIAIREKLQKKYRQESYITSTKTEVTSVQQQFLKKLKTIVEDNIDNDQFNVEDLGDKMSMSRSQIHRKLKALTNQSATQFIRNYRLYRAAELLKLDSGNITEIAYQVGFSSQTYFSKCFQELFNMSPTEYKSN